jgi:hypothetical protein
MSLIVIRYWANRTTICMMIMRIHRLIDMMIVQIIDSRYNNSNMKLHNEVFKRMGTQGQKKGFIKTAGYFMAKRKDMAILRTLRKKGTEEFIRQVN